MTHNPQSTLIEEVMEALSEHDSEGIARALSIILNASMQMERPQALGAAPYERSERALKLAIAEMYINGVSTRKFSEVVEKLGGAEISSTQVSKAAQLLDDEIETWRNREIGEIKYLIPDACKWHGKQTLFRQVVYLHSIKDLTSCIHRQRSLATIHPGVEAVPCFRRNPVTFWYEFNVVAFTTACAMHRIRGRDSSKQERRSRERFQQYYGRRLFRELRSTRWILPLSG